MTESEVLKLQKSGQFPDELVKIDRYKGDSVGGIVIIVSTIFSNFVRNSLI